MCVEKLDLLTSILFIGFLYSTTVSAQPTNTEPSSDTAQATGEQQNTTVQASMVSPKRLYEARVAMTYFLLPAPEFALALGDGKFAIYGGIQTVFPAPKEDRYSDEDANFMGFRAGVQPFVAGTFQDGGVFVNGSALYSPKTKTDQGFILMEAGFGKRWVMRTGFSIELQGGPAYFKGLGEDPDFVGGRDDTDGLPSMWLPHAALRFGYVF